MTHTPGPWAIGYGGTDGDDYAVVVSPHSQYPVCNLEPRGYTQANARLIAAAPDLLAALEAAEQAFALQALRDRTDPDMVAGWQKLQNTARAAIAAAKGA